MLISNVSMLEFFKLCKVDAKKWFIRSLTALPPLEATVNWDSSSLFAKKPSLFFVCFHIEAKSKTFILCIHVRHIFPLTCNKLLNEVYHKQCSIPLIYSAEPKFIPSVAEQGPIIKPFISDATPNFRKYPVGNALFKVWQLWQLPRCYSFVDHCLFQNFSMSRIIVKNLPNSVRNKN